MSSPNERYSQAQIEMPEKLKTMALEKSKQALKEQKSLIAELENILQEFKQNGTNESHEKLLACLTKVRSGQTHTANTIMGPHSFRSTIPLTSVTNLKNDVINELNNEKAPHSTYSTDNMVKIYKGISNEEASVLLLELRDLSYKVKELETKVEQASYLFDKYK
jgi:hypothetical protein